MLFRSYAARALTLLLSDSTSGVDRLVRHAQRHPRLEDRVLPQAHRLHVGSGGLRPIDTPHGVSRTPVVRAPGTPLAVSI